MIFMNHSKVGVINRHDLEILGNMGLTTFGTPLVQHTILPACTFLSCVTPVSQTSIRLPIIPCTSYDPWKLTTTLRLWRVTNWVFCSAVFINGHNHNMLHQQNDQVRLAQPYWTMKEGFNGQHLYGEVEAINSSKMIIYKTDFQNIM